MNLSDLAVGVAGVAKARTAETFRAPAAAHADWAVAAMPQRRRRTAAATVAFVDRGFI
jgi:hypothetical protein